MTISQIFSEAHKAAKLQAPLLKITKRLTYRQVFALELKKQWSIKKASASFVQIMLASKAAYPASYKQISYLRTLTNVPLNNTQAMKRISMAEASKAIEALKAGHQVSFSY